jgi:ribonuclease HII
MKRAVDGIAKADYVLVDAWTIPGITLPQRGIIRGDRFVKSIAAASIVAKVTRDRVMRELALQYPAYGFEIHKGYATEAHRNAIKEHGPCAAHRLTYKTFRPTL